jgi:glucose-1-phosphate cytidylyltransferase
MAVRRFVEDDEVFLANYADGLSDLPLDEHVARFMREDVVASLVGVRTSQSLHAIHAEDDNYVNRIGAIADAGFWINGGYFVLRREIFDYMKPGDELVEAPFERLIAKRKLLVYRYAGFWQSMDTFKDKIAFDRMEARGECPWAVWAREGGRRC